MHQLICLFKIDYNTVLINSSEIVVRFRVFTKSVAVNSEEEHVVTTTGQLAVIDAFFSVMTVLFNFVLKQYNLGKSYNLIIKILQELA